MLLTKTVKIKTHTRLKKYYSELGYDMSGEYVEINIEDISQNSHIIIEVKCDICGNTKFLSYDKYFKNFNSGNYYACSHKCGSDKAKQTCLKKYGVTNFTKTEEYLRKTKDKCLEKYGVEHSSKSDIVKKKRKETNIEKYGVETFLQTDKSRECLKEYFKENYDEIKQKKIKTNIEKYGVEFPQSLQNIKDKVKKTNIERHGSENGYDKDKIREKARIKLLEQYKDYNITSVNFDDNILTIYCEKCEKENTITFGQFRDRIVRNLDVCTMCTPIGSIKKEINIENLKEYELFSKKVRSLSKKNYKILFQNWDGYDYYDDEYIKENKSLKISDNGYPNVDHKISIKYGFENSISIEDLSSINNLCITKRINNLSKSRKTENEYKILFI